MSLQALQKRIHYEEMEVTGGEGGHSAFWLFDDFLMCYGKDHSHHIPKNWQQFSCFGSIARFQDALLISYMRKLVCGGCTCSIVDCTLRSLCVRHFQPIEIGKLVGLQIGLQCCSLPGFFRSKLNCLPCQYDEKRWSPRNWQGAASSPCDWFCWLLLVRFSNV